MKFLGKKCFIVMMLLSSSNSISGQILDNRTNTNNISEVNMKHGATYVNTQDKVFSTFPVYENLFCKDIQPYIHHIIDHHGMNEWKYGVLTNEIHGHLGIYAIIGMKMGLRALDELNAEHDHVQITSFAGIKPPLSCLNDGLQVSTGATLGHGLIKISEKSKKRPEAVFFHEGKHITIKLKDSYWELISNDVSNAIRQHGALTDQYWTDIRKKAISYWISWDRNEIFEIIENQ